MENNMKTKTKFKQTEIQSNSQADGAGDMNQVSNIEQKPERILMAKASRKLEPVEPLQIQNIPENVLVVHTDASYKNGIVGLSVILKKKDKEYAPKKFSVRCISPHHAELLSIKKGLKCALEFKERNENLSKILVYNDHIPSINLLSGGWIAHKQHIQELVGEIKSLCSQLGVPIKFHYIRGKKNKKADKHALKKRKSEEQKKKLHFAKRDSKLQATIERSKEILIMERDGKYFAIPRENGFLPGYPVSLDPPSCGCPWWKEKWGIKEFHIQKARAMPCKHMCALATYLGQDIREIFKKPLRRVN